MALLPRVVPRPGLMAANSLNQMTRILASVLGSAVAGIFVGVADVTWPAFAIDALTFLLSFGLVLGVRTSGWVEPSAHDEPASGGVLGSLKAVLAIVGRSPALLGTMIAAGMTMLGLGAVNACSCRS